MIRKMTGSRTARFIGMAVLVLITVVVYLPSVDGGFIWDDRDNISENATKKNLDGLRRTWTDLYANQQYYPLTHTVFWVQYNLWGEQTRGYHLTNVLIHGLNALLVLLILQALSVPGSWLAALVFAIHPVHVESVAWLSELKNVLSGFFFLASGLCFLNFLAEDQEGEGPGSRLAGKAWSLYAASLALFVLALLSKTTTCLLPAALLLVLWWKETQYSRRTFQILAPFFILGGLGALTLIWVEKYHVGAQGADFPWSFAERVIIVGKNIWFYLWKLVWPVNLNFIYPYWDLTPESLLPYSFFFLALASLALMWVLRGKTGRGPLAALLYFLLMLFPSLGFFSFYFMRYSFAQDHFQYLGSIGVLALLAAGFSRLSRRGPAGAGTAGERKLPVSPASLAAHAVLVAALVALGTLTWRQNHIYRDEVTLWRSAVRNNPQAWMAHINLGYMQLRQARWSKAADHFKAALKIRDDIPEAHLNLGNALSKEGQWSDALHHTLRALELRPSDPEAYGNLGYIYSRLGRLDEAIAHYRRALELAPDFVEAREGLRFNLIMKKMGPGTVPK